MKLMQSYKKFKLSKNMKKWKNKARQSLAVFLILILLISNRYNFADFYTTARKFQLIMLFQTISMLSSMFNSRKKTFLGDSFMPGFMHRSYDQGI
jgi:hypothetical protein